MLGDATGEMGPFDNLVNAFASRHINSWYNDFAVFVSFNYPVFCAGGGMRQGVGAGIFTFEDNYGSARSDTTFRLILTPTRGTS